MRHQSALAKVALRRLATSGLALTAHRTLTRSCATSVLVRGDPDGESAAKKAVEGLATILRGEPPDLTLWFAKGYGARAQPIGPLLQESINGSGVIIGSSAEAGLVGDGEEVQEDTFAVSVMALRFKGVRLFPFHSADMGTLPELGRGGSWAGLGSSASPPCMLVFCALPMARGANPQAFCKLLDKALLGKEEDAGLQRSPPTVIGGLTVGHHLFVDGIQYTGGAFGVAALPENQPCSTFDALVCQGAVPFGPWLEISGVANDHTISELDGKNPKEVLLPILNGPLVPGSGNTMAGILVEPNLGSKYGLPGELSSAPVGARPNCVVRPIHAFTSEGHLVISPITDDIPYAPKMQMQLQCMNRDLALEDLRMRAGLDVMDHNGAPPDAAVIISCGARGMQLYGSEGVESQALRQAWGRRVPTVGFFAGGEIGPVGRRTYMHGFTTSCLLVRNPRP